ncbi:hypothetical protein V6N11_082615 [Hibiscus sabdariffa]|uniref:Uncharacterized protein n=2 Tax=Hibiscus sabdariffa TaxID=183260 RepID=A0ABR1ZC20_9ROSI
MQEHDGEVVRSRLIWTERRRYRTRKSAARGGKEIGMWRDFYCRSTDLQLFSSAGVVKQSPCKLAGGQRSRATELTATVAATELTATVAATSTVEIKKYWF